MNSLDDLTPQQALRLELLRLAVKMDALNPVTVAQEFEAFVLQIGAQAKDDSDA